MVICIVRINISKNGHNIFLPAFVSTNFETFVLFVSEKVTTVHETNESEHNILNLKLLVM